MNTDCSWLDAYRLEIEKGRLARRDGNEGKARVCARRAAGVVARAYLETRSKEEIKGSALYKLRALTRDPGCPEPVRESAGRFLLQITPEHVLPGDIDLLDEVERLKAALFPDC